MKNKTENENIKWIKIKQKNYLPDIFKYMLISLFNKN